MILYVGGTIFVLSVGSIIAAIRPLYLILIPTQRNIGSVLHAYCKPKSTMKVFKIKIKTQEITLRGRIAYSLPYQCKNSFNFIDFVSESSLCPPTQFLRWPSQVNKVNAEKNSNFNLQIKAAL